MFISVLSAAVFGAVYFTMIAKERGTLSHRMAWIPGVMALMELAMCGALLVWDYPLLTLVLFVCRGTVLSCCSLAMKRDAAAERNRRRRRAVWRRVASDLHREVRGEVVPLHRCA